MMIAASMMLPVPAEAQALPQDHLLSGCPMPEAQVFLREAVAEGTARGVRARPARRGQPRTDDRSRRRRLDQLIPQSAVSGPLIDVASLAVVGGGPSSRGCVFRTRLRRLRRCP